ncbi:TPA: type IV toxin-antitoxin system YeeU family antitoxin, partial [Enterobacter asburiae]|nr:type IV toxin-antitoxin system YeeU family antitoxin [Enterobacter asburiae]
VIKSVWKYRGQSTHCVTLYHNGFTCEADTLGSCGYVYIAIYPTQS